jgi:hypothetical protein
MARRQETLKKIVEESFLQTIEGTFGNNLASVMLYGSYVGAHFVAGVSDVNILVLLNEPRPDQIEQLGVRGHRLMRKYRITPLILTKSEFINSADVFPMEYMDVKERNRVLFGSYDTKNLQLSLKNLRHQLEERLRGNLASLRQLITASRGRSRTIRTYLKNWYGSLGALFRALLRVKEISPLPVESEEVIDKVQRVFDVDTESFKKVLLLRRGEKVEARKLLFGLVSSLESLISKVDTLRLPA